MIYLEAIADMIQAAGHGTFGDKDNGLFIYHMPDDVINGVLLIDGVSGAIKYNDLPNYRMVNFSIICRGEDRKLLVDKSHDISEVVATNANVITPNIKFNIIRSLTDPIVLPISDGGYIEVGSTFSTNYVVTDYNY